MKHRLLLASLALALAVPPAALRAADAPASFNYRERRVLQAVADDVTTWLRDSGIPADLPITVLHIAGDRSDWFLSQVKNATSKAGLNYVEGRGDPLWDAIIAEIEWDELKDDMLDATTLTKLGNLQAAKLFFYGKLYLETTEDGRPRAELTLHVSRIETKQHIQGDTFLREEAPPPPPPVADGDKDGIVLEPLVYAQDPVESLLAVAVAPDTASKMDADLASRLVPVAENELAQADFRVENGPPDILVSLVPTMTVFSSAGGYNAFNGVVDATAAMPSLRNRKLGRQVFRATGTLQATREEALTELSGLLARQLREWLVETVTAEKAGVRVQTLAVSYRGIGGAETSARIAQFCAAAAEITGVLSCTLAERLPTGNQAVYRIVSTTGATPEGFIHQLRRAHPELKLIPVVEGADETPAP